MKVLFSGFRRHITDKRIPPQKTENVKSQLEPPHFISRSSRLRKIKKRDPEWFIHISDEVRGIRTIHFNVFNFFFRVLEFFERFIID